MSNLNELAAALDEGPVTDREIMREALALGGTITGEHGVGTLKRAFLRKQLGEDVLALQRRIKLAFDPLGLLNPGKVR